MYFNEDMGMNAPTERKLKLFRNGDSTITCDYALRSQIRMEDFFKDITDKLKLHGAKKLRLFNQNGVELYPEEFDYIKNGDVLFISKGEDFDQNSSFADYEIIKTLGEGGFGKVVLGIHRSTKEKVAIKFINPAAMSSANDMDGVFSEANMLKAMNHKNIVKILNLYTLKTSEVVIVMEYLEGGELFECVKEKGHLPEEDAKIYFKQMADAIHYCHKEKLIHRDLKLENILLVDKSTKNIKVIDFGVAGVNTNSSQNEEAGSLKYMPPECFNGALKNGAVNPSIDVWALGCILYGMLFGDLPFHGKNNKEIIDRICEAKWKVPEKFEKIISKDVRDLLTKLFQKDFKERMTMIDVVNHPWVNPYYRSDEKKVTMNIKPVMATVKEEVKETKPIGGLLFKDTKKLVGQGSVKSGIGAGSKGPPLGKYPTSTPNNAVTPKPSHHASSSFGGYPSTNGTGIGMTDSKKKMGEASPQSMTKITASSLKKIGTIKK
jgi:MAP/microtubule affinity-regulating kinase